MSDSKVLDNKNKINQTQVLDNSTTDVDTHLFNDELVSTYLLDNPGYFSRNPQVMANLKFSDNKRGVVSLVERQQQIQRQKIHLLEEEITQLLTVANYNERLFTVYNDLYLTLIDSKNLSTFLDALEQTTTQLLNLASFKLYLTNSDIAIGHGTIVKEDCAAIIAKRFDHQDYYFGRLRFNEQQAIFADQPAGSVVLIKLSDAEDCLGFIAISSNDAEHFSPSMDTLLLNQFRTLVAKLLVQQLKKVGF